VANLSSHIGQFTAVIAATSSSTPAPPAGNPAGGIESGD
jgi:hypothetical protein